MRVERGEIVLHQHLVMTDHGPVALTPSERQLLEYLTARPHQVVPLEEILEAVWGYAPHSRSQAVHVAIRRLRRKIEVDPSRPRHLKTVAGAGWLFEPLPAAAPGLVGRDADRARLEAALAESHRVCLTGPPGIGKTALARALGRGPVVELGGAATLDEALARIAAGAGCPVHELPERLGGRASIVVLDQVEHLADPLGEWLDALPAAFRCLLTSRRPIRRTSRVALGPLAAEDARELFVRRARDVGRDLAADADVDELVEVLDRNPLAIELAAARARAFGPGTLARRLRDDPLAVLDGERDLAATLRWSWEQLGDRQRHLAALAAFPAAFDAESAAAVLGEPGVVRVLDELLDHGVLRVVGDERFAVLQLVRAFAIDAAPAGLVEAARDRHAAWCARAGAPAALGALSGPSTAAALTAALPDLRAAAAWAVERGSATEAARLLLAWAEGARHVGGTDALVALAERARGLGGAPDTIATLHAAVGVARSSRGAVSTAVHALESARATAADPRLAALVHTYLAPLLGGTERAVAMADEGLALAQRAGVPGLVVGAANARALVAEAAGDARDALRWVEVACDALAPHGDHPVHRAALDANRARFLDHLGRAAEARAVWASVLPAFDASYPENAAIVRNNLAYGLWEDGRDEEASELAAFALQQHRTHGNRRHQAAPLALLGRIALRAGRLEDARRQLGAALTLARECRQEATIVTLLCELARLARAEGRPQEAGALVAEATSLATTPAQRAAVDAVTGSGG